MNLPSHLAAGGSEISQVRPAQTLEALLQHQDRSFIECAYLTILKRLYDPAGLDYYLQRLRSGIPKIQILGEIYESTEAHSKGSHLPRLRRAITVYKLSRFPWLGVVIRPFLTVEGKTVADTRLRSMEQQIFQLSKSFDARFRQTDRALRDLKTMVVSQSNQVVPSVHQSATGSSGTAAPGGVDLIQPTRSPSNTASQALQEQTAINEIPHNCAIQQLKLGEVRSQTNTALAATLAQVDQWRLGRRVGGE